MSTTILETEEQRIKRLVDNGIVPARPKRRTAVGCDLGQAGDYTSITVMISIEEPIPEIDSTLVQKLTRPRYEIVGLKRLPLGTSYPAIVNHICNLLAREDLRGSVLCLDRTGCGRPVYDLFVDAGLDPVGVTITSSDRLPKREPDSSGWRVGKLHLVSLLQSQLAIGNLKLPRNHPDTQTFLNELRNFTASVNSSTGHASFNGAPGCHDDMVCSAALSLFELAPHGDGATVEVFEL